jgi:thiosulfate/3-mercaptopyruvate sulfurtransferase
MSTSTLIECRELAENLENPDWAVVDCRFSLQEPERGRNDYLKGHIAGAVYAHLNEDLTGPIVPGQTGRHPLPDIDAFARTLSDWGVDRKVRVVAYDDAGLAMAPRLWWMLRWLGHDDVVVLNGGWPQWIAENRAVRSGVEQRVPRTFEPQLRDHLRVTAEDVARRTNDPQWRIVDSRAPERYRGEVEPIDPVAGHIPGAVNAPHRESVGSDGRFLSPEALRERFKEILGDTPAERTVFYCGSGVTAARNVFAYAHAGLGDARLYPGSWSDWIADRRRPIETG